MSQNTSILAYRIQMLEREIAAFKASGEHETLYGAKVHLIDMQSELASLRKEHEASYVPRMSVLARTLQALSQLVKRSP
jgi:stage III sporulation protein SpoIIIAA